VIDSPNPNWARWIFASVAKHFDESKGDIGLFIEGETRDSANQINEGAELRMNGPFINNPSGGYWVLDVDLNVLINTLIDEGDSHKSWRMAGVFINAFKFNIPVYRYGDQPDDDGTFLGCLQLRQDRGDDLVITNLGEISPDIRMNQMTISAIYKLEING
jgi:hypothetical protein